MNCQNIGDKKKQYVFSEKYCSSLLNDAYLINVTKISRILAPPEDLTVFKVSRKRFFTFHHFPGEKINLRFGQAPFGSTKFTSTQPSYHRLLGAAKNNVAFLSQTSFLNKFHHNA